MKRHWLAGLLMFSLGLNAVLIGMSIKQKEQPAPEPVSKASPAFKWTYTNLFPLDDKWLKLSEDQKKQLAAIRRNIDTEELHLNGQTADRWGRWVAVVSSDKMTSQTIEPCVGEMRQGIETLMLRLVHSVQAQRAVMETKDQQRLFDKKLKCQLDRLKDQARRNYNNTRARMTGLYGPDYLRSIGVEPTTETLAVAPVAATTRTTGTATTAKK